MRLVNKAVLLGALILPFAAAPASAQRWTWDLGVGGGFSWLSKLADTDNVSFGADNELKFSSSPFVSAVIGFWPSSHFGLRINGTYADNELTLTNNNDDLDLDDLNLLDHVNLWSGTFDLMYRFSRPDDEFDGMEILPYVAGGIGIKWLNPAGDSHVCIDDSELGEDGVVDETDCAVIAVGQSAFAISESSTFMGLIGLGADWRFSKGFALRTEFGDRIWNAEVDAFTATGDGTGTIVTEFSKTMHEIYLQAGLTFLFGLRPIPTVAYVAPPPPPPPAPAPPEVRREVIAVCVIDPTTTDGIRTQAAIVIEGRDTVISSNGEERPFRDAIGNTPVASNADWYLSGKPFTMQVGTQKVEFTTYGSARTIDATELAFLGTVNGIPVYADRDEVKDVIAELNELNRSKPGTDLGVLLNEQKELRSKLDDVKVVYVPLHTTGCVFQGVQRQEEVRKGK